MGQNAIIIPIESTSIWKMEMMKNQKLFRNDKPSNDM